MSTLRFSNQIVLITGAAGFIGSHLAETIMNEGGQVIGVDNFITGQKKHIDMLVEQFGTAFKFIEADVSSNPEEYLAEEQKIDLILHFASPASPPKYQEHPMETYLVNSMGTHQLLSFLRVHHPQAKFLFASTSEIYGNPLVHPQTEMYWGNVNPNGVRSCYDESKRMGETICGVFQRDFEMDVRMVRIFNTYGPRIDLEDGRIIPSFINAVLNKTPMLIFGDGSQTRSFCYVDDLVSGILALAVHPDGNGQTLNLGNPGEFTVLETVKVFELIVGESLALEHRPLPQDDPMRRQPDITKAKSLLNWEPKVSFEQGLIKTLQYFQAQH
ncbi:MAG: NAD-dependent epimerase/dehydratase family protein [Patescibacteria group bacterium]